MSLILRRRDGARDKKRRDDGVDKTAGVWKLVNFYIYFSIVVCGAAVLAIELLGTRVIAPFYGASLYLWSALISVTLAALSLGYALGGRYADRGTRMSRYAILIGLAGVWVLLIPWLKTPIINLAETLGLRTAVLVTATILFFPPLTLLGMVSPYALRMKASSLDVVGRTAGNLYAVSTVASVVAAVATGFYLIPNMGVLRLIYMIGILLIVTAGGGLIVHAKTKSGIVVPLLLIAVALIGLGAAPTLKADPDSGLIAIKQSAYAEIRVVDKDNVRYMLIDGGTHTIVDPMTWESYFPYVNVLDITKRFFHHPGEMLLIGLGGGSVVKNFVRHTWQIDAVEIDPVVTEMAHNYFGLTEDEATVFNMDGRQYLISHEKQYDIIIMDAFGSSSIPFHLVTEEAFGLIRSRLKADGLFAMNMEAVGWDDRIVSALAATAMRQFEHVVVLPIAEPPDQLGNLVMFASDRELELDRELPLPTDRFSPEYDRMHAWDNRFEVDPAGVTVFTDDLNPVDVWAEDVNLVARRQLHEFFATDGIGW